MTAANTAVDRHALHEYLWRKKDRLGKVKVNQRELAGKLGITEYAMSRIFHELLDAGRITRIGNGYRYTGVFVVADPARWLE